MNSEFERGYLAGLDYILTEGVDRNDRTGVGTTAVFAVGLTHNWEEGFPIITHRNLSPRPAMAEMSCFIHGLTDVCDFEDAGCRWWRANLNDFNERNGTPYNLDLGPIYGKLWRNFHGFDQLKWLLDEAAKNPHSRRLIVTAWDPSSQHKAVLPPCHYSWQIFIDGNRLDLQFHMRSVDWVLGCPNDFAAYAYLQLALCRHLGKKPGLLIGEFGDAHVYKNHLEGIKQFQSTPVERNLPSFSWVSGTPTDLFDIDPSHLLIDEFEQGPSVRFQMAV